MSTAALDPQVLVENLGWMRRLAIHLLQDESRADDVVQDACLAALENPPKDQSRAGGWFYAVIQNLALKSRRGVVRQSKLLESFAAHRLVAEEVSPAEQIMASQKILSHIAELPEKYQKVLILCFLEGLSPAQAAARLDVSPSTLRSQKKRALDMLRDRIRQNGTDLGAFCFALLGVQAPQALPFGTPTPTPAPLPTDWTAWGKLGAWTLAAATVVFVAYGFVVEDPIDAPSTTEPLTATANQGHAMAPAEPVVEGSSRPRRMSISGGAPVSEEASDGPIARPAMSFPVYAETPDGDSLVQSLDLPKSAFRVIASDSRPPTMLRSLRGGEFDSGFGIGRVRRSSDRGDSPRYLGEFSLDPPADLHLSLLVGEHVVESRFVESGTSSFDPFVVEPSAIEAALASVRLRVFDAEAGRFASSARIHVVAVDATPVMRLVPVTELGPSGEHTIDRIPPAPVSVHVSIDGLERQVHRLRLGLGADEDLGTIVIERAGRLVGQLIDEFGSPLAGARIQVLPMEEVDGGWGTPSVHYVSSEEDGRFEVYRVSNDDFVLIARDIGEPGLCGRPVLASVRSGTTTEVTVTRSAEVGVLEVTGSFPELETRLIVVKAVPEDLPVFATSEEGEMERSIQLAVGSYRVEVRSADGAVQSHAVELSEQGASLMLTP